MRAIEKIGITEEIFEKLYNEYNGFDGDFNTNRPTGETFMDFLDSGSKKLVRTESDLVKNIIEENEVATNVNS